MQSGMNVLDSQRNFPPPLLTRVPRWWY